MSPDTITDSLTWRVENAPNGEEYLLVGRNREALWPLYSRRRPRASAELGLPAIDETATRLVAVGVGLGYHLNHAVRSLQASGEFRELILFDYCAEFVERFRDHLPAGEYEFKVFVGPASVESFTQYVEPLDDATRVLHPNIEKWDPRYRILDQRLRIQALAPARLDGFVNKFQRGELGAEAGFALIQQLGGALFAANWARVRERKDLLELAREAWQFEAVELRHSWSDLPAGVRALLGDSGPTGELEIDLEEIGPLFGWNSSTGLALFSATGSNVRRVVGSELPPGLESIAREPQPLALVNFTDLALLEKVVALRPRGFLGAAHRTYIAYSQLHLLRALTYLQPEALAGLGAELTSWTGGAGAVERFEEFWRQHDREPLPARVIHAGVDSCLGPELQTAITRVEAARLSELEQIRARNQARYSANFDEEFQTASDQGLLRVLLITSRYTTVLQYVTRDLAAGFEQLGCKVQIESESSDTERLSDLSIARSVDEFKPHLLVQIDGLRPFFPVLPGHIPYVGWIQDRLPRFFRTEIPTQLSNRDYTFGFWPELNRELQSVGYRDVELLSSAVNDAVYHCHSVVREAFRSDLALVSNIRRPSNPHVETLVRVFAHQHGYGWGDPEHYRELLHFVETSLKIEIPDSDREKFAHQLYVDYERTIQKLEVIGWARAAGFDLKLYGRGWEAYPELREHWRGVVTPGEELRDLYRSATAHLQINLDTNVHPRVFECLASGGLTLAYRHPSDFRPGHLNDHLRKGREELTFGSQAEFHSIVDRVRRDSNYRDQVVRQGQRRVLRDHTYRNRAQQILEVVRSRTRSLPQESEVPA